jgi:hypothetical protein
MKTNVSESHSPRRPVPGDLEPSARSTSHTRWTIESVADFLGVGYHTARRLLIAEGVSRYSTTPTGGVIYPGTALKRFQRTRMSYVISDEIVHAIRRNMQGVRGSAR